MANYVKRIRTESGDLQIDYQSLANLPQSDTTLSKSGSFADAKSTGDKITKNANELTKLNNSLTTLDQSSTKSINGIEPDANGNITLKSSDVGALPNTYTAPVTSVGGKTGAVTLSAGTGISVSGTTITNTGVRSISTGGSNGTISVNTNGSSANVAVKGLGSAAYTDSGAYMPKFTFSLSDTVLTITTK